MKTELDKIAEKARAEAGRKFFAPAINHNSIYAIRRHGSGVVRFYLNGRATGRDKICRLVG